MGPSPKGLAVACALVAFVLAASIAGSTRAQTGPPFVPAGMGGCPSEWGHRAGDDHSFSCRDTRGSGFCNGARGQATSADPVGERRRRILAMGFVLASEGDEGSMHYFVYADSAGHQIMELVRPGSDVVVTCGSAPADFAQLRATFVAVASTAR